MRRLIVLLLLILAPAPQLAAGPLDQLSEDLVPSGVLLDRVLRLSPVENAEGSAGAPPLDASAWRQMLFELRHAGAKSYKTALDAREASNRRQIPIGVLDLEVQRLADESLQRTITQRVFAAAALRDASRWGRTQRFVLDPNWYLGDAPTELELDFDDGRGYRDVALGRSYEIDYPTPGTKILRLRRGERVARFTFELSGKLAPAPDDTLQVDATIPYLGEYGSGEAYVYLAPGHTQLTQPIVVIEGFDIEDSLNWDELYELLNQENLLEDLRAEGFDAVVLNFDSATDYIQRNSMIVVELLQQVQSMTPGTPLALVGASMGALCSRYALSYMEDQALPHDVAVFLSFDGPHSGANIPLGVQHWVAFFESQSESAAFLLTRLNSPAARQMLLLHHTATSGSTAQPDPLQASFAADLTALGDYPQQPRLVAIANGSGSMQDQGFAPGAQVVDWSANVGFANVVGDVWALGDGALTTIFDGVLFILFVTNQSETISVSNTLPWDGAPGGSRSTMADMDSTEAPFGDIVALHPDHCFIPTISALDLPTTDPFYDVAGHPDPVSISPFDALYFPTDNQPHVQVTAENKFWILDEMRGVLTAAPGAQRTARLELLPCIPNPFNPATTIRFRLGDESPVTLDVFDARGRLLERLLDAEHRDPGLHEIVWRPRSLASGVYTFRLESRDALVAGRVVLLK